MPLKLMTMLLFVALCAGSVLGAKLVEATVSAYRSVEAAQHEGAAFPHETQQAPSRTFGSVGTAERKCVQFPPKAWSARRSGDFEIGGQIAVLKAHTPGKVWWTTLHNPEDTKAVLVVRASRLDRPEITSRFVSSHYGWPVMKDGHAHREYAFYPTAFSLPSPVRWLLVATSGNDWGCFIVTVQ